MIQNKLNSYTSVNPFVQSVYVYNGFSKTFYDSGINAWSRDDFYDKEIIYILENFQKYQILTPIPRVIKNNTLNSMEGIKTNVYTYVFYDKQLNRDDNKLEKAIVVNIKEDFIKDAINSMSSNKSSEFFIIDSEGTLLQTNTSSKMLSKITDRTFIQKIIRNTLTQGSFVDIEQNKKSLISYTSSSVLDWKFICVTPYNIVMDQVNSMKTKVIIICCILLIFGIFASYLLAKKINSPIDYMQDNLQNLQIEQRRNLIVQKQMFLKSILQLGISSNMEKTLETLKLYASKINPLENYLVMNLKIDNYYEFCNNNNVSDRNLLKFAIMNISSELCEANFKNEVVDMGEDHMTMIINVSDSIDHMRLLKEMCINIIEAVQKYMKISVSISISSVSQNFSDISTKYNEALETSQYRVYTGSNSILMYKDILEKHSKTFSYPILKENKLIDTLMLGNIEEVENIFNEIIDTTNNYSYKSLMLTLTRITTAIHIAVDNYEKNSNYQIGYDFSKFTMELNKLEYLDDIKNHFTNQFELYIRENLRKKRHKI